MTEMRIYLDVNWVDFTTTTAEMFRCCQTTLKNRKCLRHVHRKGALCWQHFQINATSAKKSMRKKTTPKCQRCLSWDLHNRQNEILSSSAKKIPMVHRWQSIKSDDMNQKIVKTAAVIPSKKLFKKKLSATPRDSAIKRFNTYILWLTALWFFIFISLHLSIDRAFTVIKHRHIQQYKSNSNRQSSQYRSNFNSIIINNKDSLSLLL